MSAPRKAEASGTVLEDLAHMAEHLAEAIANGDVPGAREAHDAIRQGLDSMTAQPGAVVDLAHEREKRGPARRARKPRRR